MRGRPVSVEGDATPTNGRAAAAARPTDDCHSAGSPTCTVSSLIWPGRHACATGQQVEMAAGWRHGNGKETLCRWTKVRHEVMSEFQFCRESFADDPIVHVYSVAQYTT